jgi:ABC-2 type transport system ATP-binding protein
MMLQVNDLTYQYGAQTVLDGVSLELAAGQIGLLVGQNGAGKSTLLRCIAGWERLSDGTVYVNGINVQGQERAYRHQVIFVPDTPDFYDELTVGEHMQFIAQLHRLPDWETQAADLLDRFQLSPSRDAFPFTLSRGMHYKLAVALALLVQPPLLLLDEPFGPLDAVAVRDLWQTMSNFTAEGGTILFSSHTLPEGRTPDTLFHLTQGHVTTHAQPSHVNLEELFTDVD